MTYFRFHVPGLSDRCGLLVEVRLEVPVRATRVHGQGVRFRIGCHGGVC